MLARLRRLATGPAAIYLGASVLARAGSFVLIPLYTNRLTVEEYGDYTFAQTLVATLPTFFSLGLISAVARFHFDGKDADAGRERVGAVARWLIAVTLAFSAIAMALVWTVWPAGKTGIGGRWELSCVVAAAAGSAIAVIPAIYLRTAQRPIAAAGFQIVQFFSMLAGGLALVAGLNRGLSGAIEASALAFVLDGVIAIVFVAIALPGKMTRESLRRGLGFSLPFVPHFAALQLQQTADRWVMKLAALGEALGTYGLASQVLSPANMVVMAWNDASSPVMGEAYRSDGIVGLRQSFAAQWKTYLGASALPIVGLVVALPIISLFINDRYAASLWLVPVLGLGVVIESLYFPATNVVFYANRTRVIPFVTVGAGLISLGLNYLLMVVIPLGVWGAIASRIAAAIARSLAMTIAARRALAEVT